VFSKPGKETLEGNERGRKIQKPESRATLTENLDPPQQRIPENTNNAEKRKRTKVEWEPSKGNGRAQATERK